MAIGKRPRQLTNEPTRYTAYRVDGEQMYYTEEYIAWRAAKDRADAESVETFTITPGKWNGGRSASKAPERLCIIETCRKPFTPRNAIHLTCSTACARKRKNEVNRDYSRRVYTPASERGTR